MRKIALEEHFFPPGIEDYLRGLHHRSGFAGVTRGVLDSPRLRLD